MRKRRNKSRKLIRFHITYLLMGVCFVLSGYFVNLVVFTSLIIVHEMGHYLVSRLFCFKVREIVIYPYGGMTKLEDFINRNINEELLVALSGVIFQYLFYLVIMHLYNNSYIREYTFNLYTLYNSRMIFFNLLPIYPLDGSKILNLLFNKLFSYNLSNKLSIVVSIIVIVVIVSLNIYKFNYSNIMIYMVLLWYIIDYCKKLKYLYHKFMLERYLYNISFDNIRVINDYKGMYKDSSHLLCINNKYYREKDYLRKIFNV